MSVVATYLCGLGLGLVIGHYHHDQAAHVAGFVLVAGGCALACWEYRRAVRR